MAVNGPGRAGSRVVSGLAGRSGSRPSLRWVGREDLACGEGLSVGPVGQALVGGELNRLLQLIMR